MYKLSEEISINDEIDEEVDIICRIFDEFSTDLKQNYRKFKMEEILVDDKPIIKLLIKNEVILTIYNYENKKAVINNFIICNNINNCSNYAFQRRCRRKIRVCCVIFGYICIIKMW